MRKVSITLTTLLGLLAIPSTIEASEKSNIMYSEKQAPEIYGTKTATIHSKDEISLIDPKYRVFAMDFEDGDLSNKIQLLSIDGDTNYEDKIDAKTGILKNLSEGKHTLLYQVTDSHKNTTQFTTVINIISDIKSDSDIIEKTIYSAPNSNHIMNTKMNRGDTHDRQTLGIQLDPGQSIDIRIKERPAQGGNLKLDILTDGSQKDVTQKLVNGEMKTYRSKTLDEVKNIPGSKDSVGVPYIVTPRNNVQQGSASRPYTVEYKVKHNTRKLPYYRTGDNQEQFFTFWKEESEAHKRNVSLNNNKQEYRETGFAVIEGQHHLMQIPAISRVTTEKQFSNQTLDEMNNKYLKLFKQYDESIGLKTKPTKSTDQRTNTKYFMRADQNGAGAAYYGSQWIAQNSDTLDWFTSFGWGTLHEIGHGYQGANRHDNIDYSEVTNNIPAYYAQRNAEIVGNIQSYWLDLDKDMPNIQKQRMNILKSKLPTSESEAQQSELRWRSYGKYFDHHAKLAFFINMLDGVDPKNPTDAWAKINSKIRVHRAENKEDLPIANHFLEVFYEEYGIDISPYLMEWGGSHPLISKEHQEMQFKGDHIVQLQDVVYNKEKRKEIAHNLGKKEYSLVKTSDLENIPGKAKIKLKISDQELQKIKGKEITFWNDGKIIKKVTIEDSKSIEVNLPVGAYAVQFPKIYDKGYQYDYKTQYAFSTDQEVDPKAQTKFGQYYTTFTYTKEDKKILSKDSMIVLGKNGQKEGVSFLATLNPRNDRPTSDLKITLDQQFKAQEKTEINIYNQIVAGTGHFLPNPTKSYIAEKNGEFKSTSNDGRPISVADDDILEIKTTPANYDNIRNYTEHGFEYLVNRPKKEVSYYRMTNRGFREVDIQPEELENSLYEQEKINIIKQLREKLEELPEEAYKDHHAYAPLKAEIITLYEKLKEEDKKEFKDQIDRIQKSE